MNLNEAKQILEDNGYEIAKDDMNWRRSPRHIDRDEIITVDYIDQDNYEDYIGKTINVRSDVDLSYLKLNKLPLKFNKVSGNFKCIHNGLTSLEGCPKTVGEDFYCYANNLTSLEGCPESVGGDFWCSENSLTTLEGCPESVGGGFDCSNNKLTSLEGCSKTVGGYFYCFNNNLSSLEGCPESVGGVFYCYRNKVEFSPKDVEKLCDVVGVIECKDY